MKIVRENYLAGGANSPIPSPEGYPLNIVAGNGPYVIDYNSNKYIDLWMGYGALLFGHANQRILKSIKDSVSKGWFFSYQTLIEKRMAESLNSIIPSAETVRFATTGSDAVTYAIRAARAFNSRKRVLSIAGGYHGVHEGMMASEGTLDSYKSVDLIPFNDLAEAEKHLKTRNYSCLILEPILANSGCTPPAKGYLKKIREICTETETVLIFDEIVTGFRVALGGAQSLFKVVPDISVFSKAIASGLPLSAICGKKIILEQFVPTGKVFFAGTFNGSPLSLSVAQDIINGLKRSNPYSELEKMGDSLRSYLNQIIDEFKIDACVQGIASMLTIAFGCKDFSKGLKKGHYNTERYNAFVVEMAKHKVLLPPLPTETIFLSLAHKPVLKDIKRIFYTVLTKLKTNGSI